MVVHPVLLDTLTESDGWRLHRTLVREMGMLFARKAPALALHIDLADPRAAKDPLWLPDGGGDTRPPRRGPPHMFGVSRCAPQSTCGLRRCVRARFLVLFLVHGW